MTVRELAKASGDWKRSSVTSADPPDLVCVDCELGEPHVCLLLPFDDDTDVTPAEKANELDTYLHGR